MSAPKQWTIRPFAAADTPGVHRLWTAVSQYDGSIPGRTMLEIEARLAHPAHREGAGWRVAVAGNGAIVGVLECAFVGSLRTEVSCAVNPAWRRHGIGRALMETLPPERRLLTTTRASAVGSSEMLIGLGFEERYREARMRRKAQGLEPLPVPPLAGDVPQLVVDDKRDTHRLLAALAAVFGDDAETDAGLVASWLRRPGCKAVYLVTHERDAGVCVVTGSEHAKKSERGPNGESLVGVVEQVGLAKAVRGKGLSRPLVRRALVELGRTGYIDLEVTADRRRDSEVALYEAEGFTVVDDDVHWVRREPWA